MQPVPPPAGLFTGIRPTPSKMIGPRPRVVHMKAIVVLFKAAMVPYGDSQGSGVTVQSAKHCRRRDGPPVLAVRE